MPNNRFGPNKLQNTEYVDNDVDAGMSVKVGSPGGASASVRVDSVHVVLLE